MAFAACAAARPSRCAAVSSARAGSAERTTSADRPVVIVVVTDGERCLLGQSHGRLSSMRMFSALAGFMDQGESIEEAVRREVLEEAGIRVGAVRYHSSQPWPFPSSLMIGCHADALTTDLRPDDVRDASRALVRPRDGAPGPGRRRRRSAGAGFDCDRTPLDPGVGGGSELTAQAAQAPVTAREPISALAMQRVD